MLESVLDGWSPWTSCGIGARPNLEGDDDARRRQGSPSAGSYDPFQCDTRSGRMTSRSLMTSTRFATARPMPAGHVGIHAAQLEAIRGTRLARRRFRSTETGQGAKPGQTTISRDAFRHQI